MPSHPYLQLNPHRPYKIWSCNRETRKSVVAQSLLEFKVRGAEKLGYHNISDLRVVLESDGTEVEDDNYFQTAEKDTIFLLLKSEERWLPPGVEALKAAINAIPKIVCDALKTLELVNQPPTWSIRDDKGNVTVVLNWDQKDRYRRRAGDYAEPSSWRVEVVTTQPSDAQYSSTTRPYSSTASPIASTSRAKLSLDGLQQRPTSRTLPFRTLSTEDEDEDFERIERMSPLAEELDHDHSLCDFHCAALHRGGGQISVNRSAATSPVQEGIGSIPLLSAMSSSAESIDLAAARSTGAIPKKPSSAKGHVRFMDTEPTKIEISNNNHSDSETETTEREEEQLSERYLLLVDQLSAEQKRHLNVKDIGVILERLSSKIVDIDKLEREKESQELHNWVIKATIRGEVLREVGIIYNGHYYCIAEHPGYF